MIILSLKYILYKGVTKLIRFIRCIEHTSNERTLNFESSQLLRTLSLLL